MEEFDVIYFGTSIQDLIAVRSYSNSKVLVIDTKETFGDSTMQDNCTIDKLPVLMRKNDALINALVEMNIHLFIDFVNIKNHLYFYNDQNTLQFYKLPTSKSELAQCKFISNKDKCLINKFVTRGVFDFQKLDKSTINMFRKCILTNDDDLSPLIRYLESFNYYHLLFPIHGYREICENIVRCNAINGITYLLDSTIEIQTFDDKTIVKSKYGDFVTKKFVDNRSSKTQKQYVKAICYNKEFYAPLFYGVFDLAKQIHCLCLNDKAKVCPENNYLMYIWIKNEIVTDEDMVSMGIDLDSVVGAYSYYTDEFDYDYYKWQ